MDLGLVGFHEQMQNLGGTAPHPAPCRGTCSTVDVGAAGDEPGTAGTGVRTVGVAVGAASEVVGGGERTDGAGEEVGGSDGAGRDMFFNPSHSHPFPPLPPPTRLESPSPDSGFMARRSPCPRACVRGGRRGGVGGRSGWRRGRES
jgi:hypothetical protein